MELNPLIKQGKFGIERETLRVSSRCRLAQTPHPFGESPTVTRDFCENQIELVTPVCGSIPECLDSLRQLDRETRAAIAPNGETLWLYSNPPHFETEADIPVANFTGMLSNKRRYREQLERRYGKRLMLFSGIHFNFSFAEEYLQSLYSGSGSYEEHRSAFYLRLYKQVALHSWLPLLLTAVSPYYDRSLDGDHLSGVLRSEYASMRSSKRGYWNEFTPILRFESLDAFIDSIAYYVEKGLLFSSSELYLPVRLKPRGENSLENLRGGVSHIELRMFDLNPLEELGISQKDLEFTHLLLCYLSALPDFDFTPELQEQAVQNHKNAARYDLKNVTVLGIPILQKAQNILREMQQFFAGDSAAEAILAYESGKLNNRLCEQITEQNLPFDTI